MRPNEFCLPEISTENDANKSFLRLYFDESKPEELSATKGFHIKIHDQNTSASRLLNKKRDTKKNLAATQSDGHFLLIIMRYMNPACIFFLLVIPKDDVTANCMSHNVYRNSFVKEKEKKIESMLAVAVYVPLVMTRTRDH